MRALHRTIGNIHGKAMHAIAIEDAVEPLDIMALVHGGTCSLEACPRAISIAFMPCIPIVSTMELEQLGQCCVVCNLDMLGASCAMIGASCRWSYNTLRREVQKVSADDPVAAHR